MTIAEAEKFYNTDTEEYIPTHNKEFMTWLREKLQNGYYPYLNLKSIDNLVNKIKNWYELKYPNREFEMKDGIINVNFEGMDNIADNMNFEQLRYRLNPKELGVLDCEYRSYCGHCQPVWSESDEKVSSDNGWVDFIGFKVNANYPNELKVVKMMSATAIGGFIPPYEMSRLEDFTGCVPTHNITLKELIAIIKGSSNMSSPDLDQIDFTHETDLELRERIIKMVILALIYSKETTPEYGYQRAVHFSQEINQKYNINIPVPTIKELMEIEPAKLSKIEELKTLHLKRKVKKLERKNH